MSINKWSHIAYGHKHLKVVISDFFNDFPDTTCLAEAARAFLTLFAFLGCWGSGGAAFPSLPCSYAVGLRLASIQ